MLCYALSMSKADYFTDLHESFGLILTGARNPDKPWSTVEVVDGIVYKASHLFDPDALTYIDDVSIERTGLTYPVLGHALDAAVEVRLADDQATNTVRLSGGPLGFTESVTLVRELDDLGPKTDAYRWAINPHNDAATATVLSLDGTEAAAVEIAVLNATKPLPDISHLI